MTEQLQGIMGLCDAAANESREDAVNDLTFGASAANETSEDAVNDLTFGADGGEFEASEDAVNDITFGEEVSWLALKLV